MISRKQVYDLLLRLEKVSVHVYRKGKTLQLKDFSGDLTYSLSCVELSKSISTLELTILARIVLACLQKERLEIAIYCLPEDFSCVVANNSMGTQSFSKEMAIALLQCLVQFKEMEINNVA